MLAIHYFQVMVEHAEREHEMGQKKSTEGLGEDAEHVTPTVEQESADKPRPRFNTLFSEDEDSVCDDTITSPTSVCQI